MATSKKRKIAVTEKGASLSAGYSVFSLADTAEARGASAAGDFVPQTFDDYLGQEELKKKLYIYTKAALERNDPLDHVLFFGPPGLGKTTLAQIMARIMGVAIRICSGPTLERTGDLVALLSGLESRDILFIDEIHRLSTTVQEVLYGAMTHCKVDVIIGQGAGAQPVSLPINPFTLMGATTQSGLISQPLLTRFGIIERLEFYTPAELALIVRQNAQFLGLTIENEAAERIGKAARGTPRIAKRILRRIRDVAQINKSSAITAQAVTDGLTLMAIDADGLTSVDLLILQKIVVNHGGGPVGLDTIASLVGEDADTIATVYEPFLLRSGYLEKGPRGRQIPAKALMVLKRRFLGQEMWT